MALRKSLAALLALLLFSISSLAEICSPSRVSKLCCPCCPINRSSRLHAHGRQPVQAQAPPSIASSQQSAKPQSQATTSPASQDSIKPCEIEPCYRLAVLAVSPRALDRVQFTSAPPTKSVDTSLANPLERKSRPWLAAPRHRFYSLSPLSTSLRI
jgi:hypothetical protein